MKFVLKVMRKETTLDLTIQTFDLKVYDDDHRAKARVALLETLPERLCLLCAALKRLARHERARSSWLANLQMIALFPQAYFNIHKNPGWNNREHFKARLPRSRAMRWLTVLAGDYDGDGHPTTSVRWF